MAIDFGIYTPGSSTYKKSKSLLDNLDINQSYNALVMQQANSLNPSDLTAFNGISSRYPSLSRDVVLGLVRSGASADTPGIGKIASVDGIAKVMADANKLKTLPSTVKKDGSLLGSLRQGAWGAFKGTSRYTFALLRSPYDYATTVGRDLYAAATGDIGFSQVASDLSAGVFNKTTNFGALLRDQFNGKGVDAGAGFFISPESRVGKQQARAMMEYGRIGGQSYTIGRNVALGSNDPNSESFRVTSGIIDAVLNVATDPSTWFGIGDVAKVAKAIKPGASLLAEETFGLVGVAKGGKKAAEARGIASQELITQWINDVKAIPNTSKLAKESKNLREGIMRNVDNYYMNADKEAKLAEHSLHASDAFEEEIIGSTLETAFKNVSPDIEDTKILNKIADTIATDTPTEWGGTKAYDAISKISADYKNTEKIFPGAIAVEELPSAGNFVFGAQRNIEYAIGAIDNSEFKVLDMLAKPNKLSTAEKAAEIDKRAKLLDTLTGFLNDKTIPVRTRSAIREFSNKEFLDDIVFNGGQGTMADFLNKVIATKNKHAIQLATNAISDIWKVDAFGNVRAINTRGKLIKGGFLITNPSKIALKGVDYRKALSNSTLQPILSKVQANELVAKTKAARDAALAKQQKTIRDLKDIDVMREAMTKDPKLVHELLNNVENVDLRGVAELEAKIGLKKAWKEGIREEIGLVDSFGGPINLNLDKANKFILGPRFNAVAQILAKQTNVAQIMRMFNNKIDAELAVEIAKATKSDEVLRIFRNALGDPTQDINLARSMALKGETLLRTTPMFKTVSPVPYKAIKVVEAAERYFSRYVVRSTIVPLDDLTRLVNTTRQWMETLKVSPATIDKAIDKLAKAEAGTDRNVLTVRSKILDGIMLDAQTDLIAKYAPENTELAEIIKKTIRLAGQDRDLASQYTNALRINNQLPGVIYDGKKVQQMDGAVFASQFLDTMARFPDTQALIKGINNFKVNEGILGKARAATLFANEMNDIWRSAMLVMRGSYILRNIGEMQIRQYLSGHETLLANPLGYMAIMMGNPKGNGFKKWLSSIEKYKDDAMGISWKDPESERLTGNIIEDYLGALRTGTSSGDIRAVDANVRIFGKVYRTVTNTEPEYMDALATNIARYSVDDLMTHVAKADTPALEDELVAKLIFNKKLKINGKSRNNVLQDIYNASRVSRDGVKVSSFDNIFLRDPEKGFSYDNINRIGVRNWLFDKKSTGSHINELTGLMGSGDMGIYIRKLIADGQVTIPTENGNGIFLKVPRYSQAENPAEYGKLEKAFRAKLAQAIPAEKMPSGRAIYADAKGFIMKNDTQWKKINDWFFTGAAKIEDVVNYGPEYRMVFWDYIGKYAPAMSTADLERLLPMAYKNLTGIKKVVNGKALYIGKKHQTLRIITRELKSREKFGSPVTALTLEQANSLAGKQAAKYVSEIFYDATKQNMVSNAFRLAFPFAQAQFNTLNTWGKLIYRNPVKLYRFGKAFDALTKPGSNAIYDLTGTTYDADQGFFYKDEYGVTRFRYPIVGNLFGAFAGLTTNGKIPTDALQLTAPVQSLNLAIGSVNPGVPGLGPVASIAYQSSGMSHAFGPTWDLMRNYIFPYGESTGLQDMVLPAWLNKTVLSRWGNSAQVERGVKDWAGYLASTGNYGDNPFNNAQSRNDLMEDARKMSQTIGLLDGFFQSIAPATPADEILARIPDNEGKYKMTTLTMLYKAWKDISDQNPGNYDGAVGDFVAKFGMSNLMSIVSGSTRAVTGTDDAWTFLNQNPEVANKYASGKTDVIPYFFPGGEAATAYYNWQKYTGVRTKLNPTQLADAAAELAYNMELSQISDEMATYGYGRVWYSQQVIALNKRYGGSKPVSTLMSGLQQNRIDVINEAIKDPAMQQSPVYKETSIFMDAYNNAISALQDVRLTPEPDLGSSYAMNSIYREQLTTLGKQLVRDNPQFANMYYLVFANLLKENK